MKSFNFKNFIFKQHCVPWRILHWLANNTPLLYSIFMKGNPNTQKYWDETWQDEERREKSERLGNIYKAIVNFVPEHSKVLDIGCGVGELLLRLKEAKKCECYGLDISAYAIHELERKGIPGKLASLPRIPFPSQHFDVVIATEIFEHLYRLKKTLNSIRRTLKKDGVLLVSAPNNVLFPEDVYEHVRYFTKGSLYRLLVPYFSRIEINILKDVGAEREHLLAIASNPKV